MAKLRRAFFNRDPEDVARELIGVTIVVRSGDEIRRARIVETEAYGGSNDPASHSYRGPTPRTKVMFGPPGHLYVYLSYGVHWCANIVTEREGVATAVLFRGAELERVDESGGALSPLRGPGNFTKGLGITITDNGVDCCARESTRLWFESPHHAVAAESIGRSRRIGISKARDQLSRYFLIGSKGVSRMPKDAADTKAT